MCWRPSGLECLAGYVGPVTGSCNRRRARTIGHNYIAVTGSRNRRRATTRALQNMQLSSDATSKAQLNHPDVPHSMQHAYALYPRSTLRCNPDRATRYSMQRATCNVQRTQPPFFQSMFSIIVGWPRSLRPVAWHCLGCMVVLVQALQ